MNEITYRKLNSTEAIISAMPKLIEAFITYYGESERENIQNKFHNLLVIGYSNPEQINSIIRDDKKQKSNELIENFLRKINVNPEKTNEFRNIYFSNYDMDYPNLHPIFKYITYINGDERQKNNAVDFISKLYPQVTVDNIDELISSGKLSNLNEIIKEYQDIINQYHEYELVFKPYKEYEERCKQLKDSLEKKYTKMLVDEFKHLFTEEELKQIDSKLNGRYKISLAYLNKKTENYFPIYFNGRALIDAFSIDNSQLLLTGAEWKKNSVIKDRIKYFKNLGIDLGDEYEIYLNHPDVKKIFEPLQELAEQIISKRNELYTKMMNEYYCSIEGYKNNMQKIEQAGLLDQEHGYNANAYENAGTFVSTNIKESANGYIMYPILCLSINNNKDYLDAALIHELNHVYELHLEKLEDNKYYGTSGWDLVDGSIYNERPKEVSLEEDAEKRKYELFNEIINELISQEITSILFEADGYIFNTKEDAKIKGKSSYEKTTFLIKEFYNTYKKEIIESRKNGNIGILFDAVGKENFELLNELFHAFNELFPGLEFLNVLDSIKKNEETEKSKQFKEIVEKRNEILKLMHEHNQKRSFSL